MFFLQHARYRRSRISIIISRPKEGRGEEDGHGMNRRRPDWVWQIASLIRRRRGERRGGGGGGGRRRELCDFLYERCKFNAQSYANFVLEWKKNSKRWLFLSQFLPLMQNATRRSHFWLEFFFSFRSDTAQSPFLSKVVDGLDTKKKFSSSPSPPHPSSSSLSSYSKVGCAGRKALMPTPPKRCCCCWLTSDHSQSVGIRAAQLWNQYSTSSDFPHFLGRNFFFDDLSHIKKSALVFLSDVFTFFFFCLEREREAKKCEFSTSPSPPPPPP